jgi:predicted pyridoxine 5'-phosphate oxidase superfamily flavin-nucleotide-binding protein
MSRYATLAYTQGVRQVQRENGSDRAAARALVDDGPDLLTATETEFIGGRDGFYLASVGDTGWPYLQFRGGPPGFVHVLDERTLAYAEVRGNRQYITAGNVRGDDRVALFFMDYARQRRLKLLGHAHAVGLDERPDLTARLRDIQTDGRAERLTIVDVEGFNWNCPQHITPRYTEAELASALRPIRDRLAQLEEENRALRARVSSPS